ncbi:MAG: hypothetical protein M3512_17675 [Bacteroidota bacterium]|nr:hypothetical protein [Bacteroidota bacterium]
MRFISTKAHGIMDYTVGTILSVGPALLGPKYKTARKLLFASGMAATIYSLFTNYELGAVKKLSMKTHLTLDVLSGLFLVASPWLFVLNKEEKAPLMISGLVEIGAGLLSKTE